MSKPELPGAELVDQGLIDLADGRETVESLLVSMAAPRLRSLGYTVPTPLEEPELRLYRMLGGQFGNGAHGQYNGLVRRLVSFQHAAARAS